MVTSTLKRGDSLSDLEWELRDRTGVALDLTNATSVLLYLRRSGATTNTVDGLTCSIELPRTSGRVTGPAQSMTTSGDYEGYFKVNYGSESKRIPSKGLVFVNVENNYEA